MIRTLFFQPLGPALVLLLGGLLLWLASWLAWRDKTARRTALRLRFRALFALLLVVGASLLWLRISGVPERQSLSWAWQPLTVAGATIHWRADPWNWFVALVILLLAAAKILADDDAVPPPAVGTLERTLWLAAAAMLFVCSANVITLAAGWLALDAALVFCLMPGRHAEPAGRAWGLLAMTTPMLLLVLARLGENGIPAPLAGGPFTREAATLLWVLALLRTGVYPFHLWLTAPGRLQMRTQYAAQVIGPVAGIWLVARVQRLAGADLARHPEWAALGALALLGTALAAWTVETAPERWRWITVNRASSILLAAYALAAPGPHAFAWSLAAFGLGATLLAPGFTSAGGAQRVPAIIGALVLWGAPGTVGLLARTALLFPTELVLAAPLFAVVLVSEVLLVAALWEMARTAGPNTPAARSPIQRPSVSRVVWVRLSLATLILAVPAIAWGLQPQQLAGLAGFPANTNELALWQAAITARRSVWIGLAVSGIGGVILGLLRPRIFGRMRGWQQGIAQIVGLGWLYQGVVAGLRLVGGGLHYFATLGEGEGYLGWLALAGLILWVLLRG